MSTVQRMTAADRRKLILNAAGELFIARGYSGVTMEDVLAKVGGSKATLYRHFADKAELFQAAVEALCDEWSKPVHTFTAPPDADLTTTLTALGGHFAALVLTPQAIALHRLVTAEAERMPEVGRAFFEHGPSAGQRVLAKYLQQARDAGEIDVSDPVRAAAQLFQAMLGDAQMRLLTNSPHKPDDDEVQEGIAVAVRVFLHGATASRGDAL